MVSPDLAGAVEDRQAVVGIVMHPNMHFDIMVPPGAWRDLQGHRLVADGKRPAIRKAIRSIGAKLLFLPPYSPDLNPIEQVFSKLKHLLRKAAERTHEQTWMKIGELLDHFKPAECANYLTNSGYASI